MFAILNLKKKYGAKRVRDLAKMDLSNEDLQTIGYTYFNFKVTLGEYVNVDDYLHADGYIYPTMEDKITNEIKNMDDLLDCYETHNTVLDKLYKENRPCLAMLDDDNNFCRLIGYLLEHNRYDDIRFYLSTMSVDKNFDSKRYNSNRPKTDRLYIYDESIYNWLSTYQNIYKLCYSPYDIDILDAETLAIELTDDCFSEFMAKHCYVNDKFYYVLYNCGLLDDQKLNAIERSYIKLCLSTNNRLHLIQSILNKKINNNTIITKEIHKILTDKQCGMIYCTKDTVVPYGNHFIYKYYKWTPISELNFQIFNSMYDDLQKLTKSDKLYIDITVVENYLFDVLSKHRLIINNIQLSASCCDRQLINMIFPHLDKKLLIIHCNTCKLSDCSINNPIKTKRC